MMAPQFNRSPTAYIPKLLLLSLCFLFTLSTHRLALAQTYYTPIVVSGAAFVRATTDLYIISGAAGANPGIQVAQLVSLDLNISWNTTNPAWTKHNDGPKQDLFPAAFSSDEKILYLFHLPQTSSPYQWDSNTEGWKEMTNVKFANATWQGIGAVTDPNTGLIYMAGGYNDDSNLGSDPTFLAMDVFDPVSQTVNRTHLTLPPSTFLSRMYYGNVWCKARSSILYWGGHAYKLPPSTKIDMVSEFKPDTQTWATMVTTGTTPAMRADHCMVSNEDGSKVLVHGGRLENMTVVGDISILDTATQTWTTYSPPASYRDLKDPPPLTRTTAPWPVSPGEGVVGLSNGGKGPEGAAGSPVGAIVGGLVSGMVLIVVGVGFLVFRRRRLTRGVGGQGGPRLDEKDEGGFFEAWANGQSGLAVLKRRAQAPFTGKTKKEGHQEEAKRPVSEEAELQQTLRELQDLENQQQELEQKRLQLVLQQQQQMPYPPPPPLTTNTSGHLRGPTEYSESLSEYRPPPNNPEFVAPPSSSSTEGDSNFIGFEGSGGNGVGKVGERRTVQDTTGLSTNFMDWTVQPPNNPHAIVTSAGVGVAGGGGSRPVYLQHQQQQQQHQQYSRAMSM
ncbi:hypothetical protein BG015_011969 [Linnemannia schmuckeri]|uniref:Kelch repeat-containing protein n=1 Tax=Linnemannia schmuckeri TaxID=64567 RepID=A0A9P5VEC0_9FUNG|nr:hypothetical protein BG015_011969 [Linnemannia schmuckeri]